MAVTTPTLAQRIAPATPGFAPVPGERLLYRHRRRTPTATYAFVGAGACVGLAVGSGAPTLLIPLLLVVAAALAVLGMRLRRGSWLEDLAVTDRRVVRRRPDGSGAELALDELDEVVSKGTGFVFRSGLRELTFPHVDSPRRVRRVLAEQVPAVPVDMRFDLACPT